MPGRFTGWPEQAFDVLLELDGEPRSRSAMAYVGIGSGWSGSR